MYKCKIDVLWMLFIKKFRPLKNLNLSSFNTSKVDDMIEMFDNSRNLIISNRNKNI